MNLNANGGVLYEYGNEYIVRGVLSTDKVDQIAKAVVRSNGVSGAPILLEDIADVQSEPNFLNWVPPRNAVSMPYC